MPWWSWSPAPPAPVRDREPRSSCGSTCRRSCGARSAPGESCEVAGFGPIAASAVRDLIDTGDPFLAAVVTRGTQVVGVAHLGRRANATQQTALEWLYPTCAAEGCS